MTTVEEIRKKHDTGYPRLVKLFKLSDSELKEYLKNLFPDHAKKYDLIYSDTAQVTREIVDSKVDSIHISYYDTIEIDWFSIRHKPKHGCSKPLLDISNENIGLTIPEPKEPFII